MKGYHCLLFKCLEELTAEAIRFFVSRNFITHSVSLLVIGLFISYRVEVFEWVEEACSTTSSGRGAFQMRMKAYTQVQRGKKVLYLDSVFHVVGEPRKGRMS